MKKKFWTVLSIIVIALSTLFLIYELFVAETRDMKVVRRAVTLLIIYLGSLYRISRRPSRFNRRLYEKNYAPYLGQAFRDDKKSYRTLMKAIGYFNADGSQKAIGYLYQLEEKCVSADDFGAVYFFMALCFDELDMEINTVECYEKLLMHKPSHSMALSNLGLIYQNKGQPEKAEELYRKAIEADPYNPYGYSNLANHYLRMGEPELALEQARKSMQLDLNVHPAISAAALACALLGMDEDAEEYCRLYGTHGGNSSELRKIIAARMTEGSA
ncbi:MAG: tetratricopeptide repeat protein [Oscillospiraceae bacterium]|nr:tetratricopeptide repeat protein [Oscillospiraceae bacterium]